MTRSYTERPCRSCRAPTPAHLYLCRDCWAQLPARARRALTRRDSRAFARLRELHAQLDSGRALTDIEVTP